MKTISLNIDNLTPNTLDNNAGRPIAKGSEVFI